MSVKKNLTYNIAYQILSMILPLITTPYIARVIGPEGLGIQSYTYSIVSYFVLFAMLGINNYGNRSIAIVRDNKDKLNKTFSSIYAFQIIMSLIIGIIYIIYVIFIAKYYKMFFIIQGLYIIGALLDINWFFFGLEEFKLTVIRNIIIKILSVFCVFIFVKDTSDIYMYSLILALSTLLSQLILWKFIKKHVSFKKVTFKEIFNHFKPLVILFIPVIAISLYKIMDKIMLGSISNVTQVGFYENSEKIISIPMGIITALGTVMLPKMANLESKRDNKQSQRYFSMSIQFIMFIAFGAMFGLVAISKVFIPIFLGEEFNYCINLVSLLAFNIPFLAWANVIRTQFLIPKSKDNIYIISTILGAIVNLITNLLLITKYGALGAGIGTLFAEVTVAIYQTIMIRKELNIYYYIKKSIFYIIPGIIMYFIIIIIGSKLGNSIISGIVQAVTGGVIYILISLAYMICTNNEIIDKFIKKIKYR